MDRRDFLKVSGAGAAALGLAAAGVSSCKRESSEDILSRGPEAMKQNYPGIGLLGFGAMRWPMKENAEGKKEIDQDAVNGMVDYAIAHGVNYFDSAPVYLRGKSERATAIALLRHPREKYVIATKMSNFNASLPLAGCVAMFEKSLEYYETTYVDYYLMHSLSGAAEMKERYLDNGLLDYLLEQRKQGRIRNLGFSFHGDDRGFDEMMAFYEKYNLDFVQIQMNYIDWKNASQDASSEYMYGELARRDIPVVIMEPLLGGRLADIPAVLFDRLKAEQPAASAASWAMRFCGSFPKVLTVLSGMTCMEHLQDNLKTFLDFKPLTDEEFGILDWVAAEMAKFPLVRCTTCQYCMPCPYGIDIPGIFKFYNDSVREGTFVVGKEQKDFQRARRLYLASYSEAVESVRQADHCIGCGQCLGKCPQHIPIPDTLHRIDDYIDQLKKL